MREVFAVVKLDSVLKVLYVQKIENVIMGFVVPVKKDKMFVNECYRRVTDVVNQIVCIYGLMNVLVLMA